MARSINENQSLDKQAAFQNPLKKKVAVPLLYNSPIDEK